ncbi:hypothetical protein ACNOYE_18415 [Nannocystaceae bacterium ST9]
MNKSSDSKKKTKLSIAKQTVRKLGQNEVVGQVWTFGTQCCANSITCY